MRRLLAYLSQLVTICYKDVCLTEARHVTTVRASLVLKFSQHVTPPQNCIIKEVFKAC